jgi:bifunctional DNA-binding transcriptional regulator/antitoxin component of YhaV-PrlF toxin-antitoxin module
MTSIVTGKKQVTIPAEVARQVGIERGTRVEWSVRAGRRELVMKVLPSRGELALSVMGIGRKYLKPGDDPIAELIAERIRDDRECDHAEEAE